MIQPSLTIREFSYKLVAGSTKEVLAEAASRRLRESHPFSVVLGEVANHRLRALRRNWVVLVAEASHQLRALYSNWVVPGVAASRQRLMCDRLSPVYRLKG